MATRSIIPVARLNSRVRKRLIDILSGQEIPNKSLIHSSSSPGFECQQHLGHFHPGEGSSLISRRTKVDGSKRSKIEFVGQVRRKPFQRKLQSSVESKGLMELDKGEREGSGNEASSKSKSDTADTARENKERPKSGKARNFRRYMRAVACTQEGPSRQESRSDSDLASREKHFRKKARSNCSNKNGKHSKKAQGNPVSDEDKHGKDKEKFAPKSEARGQKCAGEDAGLSARSCPSDIIEPMDSFSQSGCLVTAISGNYEIEGTEFRLKGNFAGKEKSAEVRESQGDVTREVKGDIMISKSEHDLNNDNNRTENCPQNDEVLSKNMIKECTSEDANDETVAQAEEELDGSYCLDVLFNPASHAKNGVFNKVGSKMAQKKRDKRKRRGKKDCEMKFVGEEQQKEEPGVADKGAKINAKRLPNYFLALKVDNTALADNVKQFQESVMEIEPAFKNVMIAVPTLHLTLMVMRLDNDIDIDNAKQALQSLKEKSGDLFAKWSKAISFTGIDTFRNKVIYLGIDHEKEKESIAVIQEIVKFAHECFSLSGVELTEDKSKGEFTPHVTVMKMSKNIYKMKKKGIKKVDETYYKDYTGFEFGQEQFSEILLCSMLDKKDENGFYKVIDRLNING